MNHKKAFMELEYIEDRVCQLIESDPDRDWATDVKEFLEQRIYPLLQDHKRLEIIKKEQRQKIKQLERTFVDSLR